MQPHASVLSCLSFIFCMTVGGACDGCTDEPHKRSDFHEQKLQFELSKLLSKLGLVERPQVNMQPEDIPSILVRRTADPVAATPDAPEDDADITEPQEFFVVGDSPNKGSKQCMTSGGQMALCLEFNLNKSELFSNNIDKAGLLLHLEPSSSWESQQTIVISEITKKKGRPQSVPVPVSTEQVNFESNWIELNITQLALDWQMHRDQTSRHLLQVTCSTCPSAAVAPFGSRGKRAPSIHVTLASPQSRKRRSNLCMVGDGQSCCLEKFTVNFTEIGWSDWILQPTHYDANYCTGNCATWTTTQHGRLVLEKVLRAKDSDSGFDQRMIPCCSPSKMAPLDVIYALSEGEIRKRNIPQMVVQSCGC